MNYSAFYRPQLFRFTVGRDAALEEAMMDLQKAPRQFVFMGSHYDEALNYCLLLSSELNARGFQSELIAGELFTAHRFTPPPRLKLQETVAPAEAIHKLLVQCSLRLNRMKAGDSDFPPHLAFIFYETIASDAAALQELAKLLKYSALAGIYIVLFVLDDFDDAGELTPHFEEVLALGVYPHAEPYSIVFKKRYIELEHPASVYTATRLLRTGELQAIAIHEYAPKQENNEFFGIFSKKKAPAAALESYRKV